MAFDIAQGNSVIKTISPIYIATPNISSTFFCCEYDTECGPKEHARGAYHEPIVNTMPYPVLQISSFCKHLGPPKIK